MTTREVKQSVFGILLQNRETVFTRNDLMMRVSIWAEPWQVKNALSQLIREGIAAQLGTGEYCAGPKIMYLEPARTT